MNPIEGIKARREQARLKKEAEARAKAHQTEVIQIEIERTKKWCGHMGE